MFVIIGSSGGTTDVMMRMQRRKSFCLSRDSSLRPSFKTYREATMLRTRSMPSRMKASVCLSEMFSLLKMTERESLPLAVSKPVLIT